VPEARRAGVRRRRGRDVRVAFITLGCPKNLVDAEVMIALVEEAGHTLVPDVTGADVAVVNTCAFISAALDESSAVIDQCLELRAKGALAGVVVSGCMPERLGSGMGRFGNLVDAVVGCSALDRLPDALRAVGEGRRFAALAETHFVYGHETPRTLGTPSHLAYVKIAEGCSNRCAYCTIPSIRGPLQSRSPDSIVREVADLARCGVREVNLIAQDTTAYGTDLAHSVNLPALLRRLGSTAAPWIRLLYSHPAHVNGELLSVIAEEDRIVPYLDLPIQHVADRILEAMGRRIGGRGVRAVLARVRRVVPGVSIRSSVMVGFPGETDEEFEELLDFVAGGPIDHLGVFEFSPEPGTRAYALPGRVPREVASARARLLIDTMEELTAERARTRAGEVVTVLADADGSARTAGQAWETDGVVLWDGGVRRRPRAGEFARARITGGVGFDLTAVPVSGSGDDAV
jgi:ribosomal protein S12 methylthiotransferase